MSGLAETIRRVEALCAEKSATPRDLPAPSRRALADLRALAQLAPDALPDPRDGAPVRRPLSIRNVVSTLNRTLSDLSWVEREGEDVDDALIHARACVEAVERICEEDGATPAALPIRTGEAYAFLRWLLDGDNLAHYLDRRDVAAAAFHSAVRQGTGAPSEWSGLRPCVRFQPGRRVYRLAPEGGILDCRLGVGWLGAGDEDLATLGRVAVQRSAAHPDQTAAHRAFLDSEDYGSLHHELMTLRDGASHMPQGRVRDLGVLFAQLKERFFGDSLSRPHLAWHVGASLRRFGSYLASHDQVDIDVRLDDEGVPEFVVEFVLYHELLHKVHGARMRGQRRHVHTPAFRADERKFPRWKEAETWLARIATEGAESDAGNGSKPHRHPRRPAPVPAPLPMNAFAQPPCADPRPSAKVPRNAPCPCGSGRKHKKCCLG